MSENNHLRAIRNVADGILEFAFAPTKQDYAALQSRLAIIDEHAEALASDLERMTAYAQALEHDYAIERETMIFGGGDDLVERCERYTSREDAERGHAAMVEQVRATLRSRATLEDAT